MAGTHEYSVGGISATSQMFYIRLGIVIVKVSVGGVAAWRTGKGSKREW